jgi:hypothetical protein
MKWLLILLLVSCGKNKMPEAVDLNDNDGDQIPNHLEVDESKNIANFVPVDEVNGEMSFFLGNVVKQELILKISNKRDILAESLDILTRSELKQVPEEFFSEWSKITIELPVKLPELPDRIFDLNLSFLPSKSSPDYILLIKGQEYIKLGDFSPNMKLKLTMKDLDLLLKGDAHLAFGKRTMVQNYVDSQPIQQTIREKTYRVFLNDGDKASILYVAKDYSFNDFLKSRGLNNVINFQNINAFQYNELQAQWFYRHLPTGDMVLVKTDQVSMLSSYLKNYKKIDFNLQRINGNQINSLQINKSPLAMVQLKIRPTQTKRTFREYQDRSLWMIGGGDSKWTCINYHRAIDSEVQVQPSMDEILSNLLFRLNGVTASLAEVDHSISMKDDENGQYLLVSLPKLPESLEVYLQTNANNTFVSTGQYDLNCPKGYPVRGSVSVVPTNIEGHLTLTLEAYVEKLD